MHYSEYLQLDKLLQAQRPLGETDDETLFIIVHQAYELWFKQILVELEGVRKIFSSSKVEERQLPLAVAKLERVDKIITLFPSLFDILETMAPIDFLQFRHSLVPASGFQSVQFRKMELMLGLRGKGAMDSDFLGGQLKEEEKRELVAEEGMPSLFELVEKWLERMPFSMDNEFNFWTEYGKVVNEMLEKEKMATKSIPSPQEREAHLKNLASMGATFASILNPDQGKEEANRPSNKALVNALFIFLFRQEPLLTWPTHLLTSFMNIDEHLTSWRYRHSLLAHRMLGRKMGTGGSSGMAYLKMTAEKNRPFKAFFDLSSCLVTRQSLPPMPEKLRKKLAFIFQ